MAVVDRCRLRPLQADFDYGKDYEAVPRFKYTKVGGYEGGDSLVLSGKLSNDNTIRLYKTDLDVAAGSKIDLTYNRLNSDDSKLQLGLILADDPADRGAGGRDGRFGRQRLEDRERGPVPVRG